MIEKVISSRSTRRTNKRSSRMWIQLQTLFMSPSSVFESMGDFVDWPFYLKKLSDVNASQPLLYDETRRYSWIIYVQGSQYTNHTLENVWSRVLLGLSREPHHETNRNLTKWLLNGLLRISIKNFRKGWRFMHDEVHKLCDQKLLGFDDFLGEHSCRRYFVMRDLWTSPKHKAMSSPRRKKKVPNQCFSQFKFQSPRRFSRFIGR